MNTLEVKRLWRVVWVHRNGYLAPAQYVWAKVERRQSWLEKRFVTEWAREHSRLSAFPKEWYYKLEALEIYDPPREGKGPKGPFSQCSNTLFSMLFNDKTFYSDVFQWKSGNACYNTDRGKLSFNCAA